MAYDKKDEDGILNKQNSASIFQNQCKFGEIKGVCSKR